MTEKTFYVVGIGASAGGLQALKAFVRNLEAGPLAFIIVQHLLRDQPSALPEILQKACLIPVIEILGGETIEPGNVYVMPSGKKLRIEQNQLVLEERPKSEIINEAIDHFFLSLAEEYGPRAFGVILSGTGTDGVKGVKKIEDEGGVVLVQDPATAQFKGMPENTIHLDHPDYVASPENIPGLIVGIIKNY